jgi:hypothetical protein
MEQQNLEQKSTKTFTVEITWRTFGYLGAILLLGVAMGLLLYPMVTYPSVVSYGMMGIAILLIALTAPLFRKK